MVTDIEGNVLVVGDYVYYARIRRRDSSELVKKQITKIVDGEVWMNKYHSTRPSSQLAKSN